MRGRPSARRVVAFEPLEGRLCLDSSVGWDGPGQRAVTLTYYIGQTPSYLSRTTVVGALKTALRAWEAVADIRFIQTNRPNRPNSIDLTFRRLDTASAHQ